MRREIRFLHIYIKSRADNFWSESRSIATSDGVTLDVLKEYVETQNMRPSRPHGTKKKK